MNYLLGLLGLGGLYMLFKGSKASGSSSSSSATPADLLEPPKRYRVIGDSYAVGIKSVLPGLYPQTPVEGAPVVGMSSPAMPVADDRDGITFVSAGTNDAASGFYNVDKIIRVLGPYAEGTATKGRLYYVVPHTKMSEPIKGKVRALLDKLLPQLKESSRFKLVFIEASPTAPDGIHFDKAGYESIVEQAARIK